MEGEYLAVGERWEGAVTGCRSCTAWAVVVVRTDLVTGNWEAVKLV